MGMDRAGELVGIAYANDRVEAEMIQGFLEGAGIPSAVHQLGVDGPLLGIGLLNPGGGSRRVVVRADQAEAARTVLAEMLVEGEQDDWDEFSDADHPSGARRHKPRNYALIGAYARIWFWSFTARGLAFAVFLLLRLV
jgi:Putative prokaryotic signal transducing protein